MRAGYPRRDMFNRVKLREQGRKDDCAYSTGP